jgi:hypothetical protein
MSEPSSPPLDSLLADIMRRLDDSEKELAKIKEKIDFLLRRQLGIKGDDADTQTGV